MTETVYHKGWTFTNFPRLLSQRDYESVEEEVVDSLGRLREDSCSVFEIIGRSRTRYSLGISDIDYLIFTDHVTEGLKDIFNLKGDGSVKDAVLFHDQLFIPFKLARDAKRFLFKDEEVKLKLIFGKEVLFEGSKLIDNDLRLLEDLVFHNAKDISNFLKKEINVRLVIHKLKSIEHFSQDRILMRDEPLKKDLDNYFNELNALKDDWFKRSIASNLDLLIRLVDKNFQLYNKLLRKLDEYFTKNYLNSEKIEELIFKEPSTPIIFKDSDDYIGEIKKIRNITGKIIPVLPKNLSFLPILHSKGDGLISKHLRKHLLPLQDKMWGGLRSHKRLGPEDCCADLKDLQEAMRERNHFYEEHLRFCKENSLNYGPLISFDLHEQSPAKPIKLLKRKAKKFLKRVEMDRVLTSIDLK